MLQRCNAIRMLVSLDYWQFVFLSNLAVVSGEARCFIAAVYTSLKGWGLIGIPLVIFKIQTLAQAVPSTRNTSF